MIAADHDRGLDLSALHQIVHGKTELRTFPVAQPADPRGQSLESNSLARQIDPAAQNAVLGEHLQNQVVCNSDIRRLPRERNPAEWAASFAEEWTDICGYKSGKIVGILNAM